MYMFRSLIIVLIYIDCTSGYLQERNVALNNKKYTIM